MGLFQTLFITCALLVDVMATYRARKIHVASLQQHPGVPQAPEIPSLQVGRVHPVREHTHTGICHSTVTKE